MLVDAVNGLQDEVTALQRAKADINFVPTSAAFAELRQEVEATKVAATKAGGQVGTEQPNLCERVEKLSLRVDGLPPVTEFAQLSAKLEKLSVLVGAVTSDTSIRATGRDLDLLRAEVAAAKAPAREEAAPGAARALESLRGEVAEVRARLDKAPAAFDPLTRVDVQKLTMERTNRTSFVEVVSWRLVPPVGGGTLLAEALIQACVEGKGVVGVELLMDVVQESKSLHTTIRGVKGTDICWQVVPLLFAQALDSSKECQVRLFCRACEKDNTAWVGKAMLKSSWQPTATSTTSS